MEKQFPLCPECNDGTRMKDHLAMFADDNRPGIGISRLAWKCPQCEGIILQPEPERPAGSLVYTFAGIEKSTGPTLPE